jgi:hypothetical protein
MVVFIRPSPHSTTIGRKVPEFPSSPVNHVIASQISASEDILNNSKGMMEQKRSAYMWSETD